jgi:Tfp pilus assembly protein PilF
VKPLVLAACSICLLAACAGRPPEREEAPSREIPAEEAPPAPEDAAALRRLAEAALAGGRLEEAQERSARALDLGPDDPDSLLLRARVLAAAGSWPPALRLLELPPVSGLTPALLLKAEILAADAHEEEQALELLRGAQAGFPGDARLPELEGRILVAAGRDGEGRLRLERALELEPGRESAVRLLAELAARERRWEEAAGLLDRLLAASESEADLDLARRVQERLGNAARALDYASRLHALRPEAWAAGYEALRLVVRAEALAAQDPERATETLQQALTLDPVSLPALLALAALFEARQDFRKAGLYLRQALELDPANAELATRLERLNY